MARARAVSMFRPMSLSKMIPGAGAKPRRPPPAGARFAGVCGLSPPLPPSCTGALIGSCMATLRDVEPGQAIVRIAEAFDSHTHAVHQAQMQIAEWGFLPVDNAPSRF